MARWERKKKKTEGEQGQPNARRYLYSSKGEEEKRGQIGCKGLRNEGVITRNIGEKRTCTLEGETNAKGEKRWFGTSLI